MPPRVTSSSADTGGRLVISAQFRSTCFFIATWSAGACTCGDGSWLNDGLCRAQKIGEQQPRERLNTTPTLAGTNAPAIGTPAGSSVLQHGFTTKLTMFRCGLRYGQITSFVYDSPRRTQWSNSARRNFDAPPAWSARAILRR